MKIKSLPFIAAVGVLAVISLINCNKSKEDHTTDQEHNTNESFRNKLIDQKIMSELDENYTANNYQLINSARPEGKPDSREYWYSVEELEGYIAFAKKEAASKNYKLVGLKIKMGQYPEKGPFDARLNPKLYGYQAVYIVPTVIPSTKTAQVKTDSATDSTLRGVEADGVPGMDLSWTSPPY